MNASRTLRTALAAALALSLVAPAVGAGFTDVLDTPAQMSRFAKLIGELIDGLVKVMASFGIAARNRSIAI
jgi:hypothetical protein